MLTAVNIHARPVIWITVDPRKTHGYPAVRIGTTKTSTISPGGVKKTIRPARHWPKVATGCREGEGVPVPIDTFDSPTWWVGRHGLGGSDSCRAFSPCPRGRKHLAGTAQSNGQKRLQRHANDYEVNLLRQQGLANVIDQSSPEGILADLCQR